MPSTFVYLSLIFGASSLPTITSTSGSWNAVQMQRFGPMPLQECKEMAAAIRAATSRLQASCGDGQQQ